MKADALPIPGIVLGAYPERGRSTPRTVSRGIHRASGLFSSFGARHRYLRFVAHVNARDANVGQLDTAGILERLNDVRAAMARDGMTDDHIAEVFVLIKRVCARELGVELFPTQLMAARIMLDRRLAEMATGEGKTLAAGLCVSTAALAGIPVHVITANDYLVVRDAEYLAPLYQALGLSVGAVTQSLDHEGRRHAYACNIVYCTAKELVFDYLRDGRLRPHCRSDLQQRVSTLGVPAAGGGLLLQGLCMAVVDEADSILIDEARIPLILSERCDNDGERRYLSEALQLATRLAAGDDFVLHLERMSAELTVGGAGVLERLSNGVDRTWRNRLHRDETVCTALVALHLYKQDRHYLVRDGAVSIIDEPTGRVAPGRVWSRGLHQLIELKEHCRPSDATVTIAQITYQRFFQRYLALAGMSGTLGEARSELRSTYGLQVVEVPLGRNSRRTLLPTRLFPNREAQWQAVIEQAMTISHSDRPVLIATDSVVESEEISRLLAAAGLPHAVLNARQDKEEAHVIARAGQFRQITVATNMAGRGTDITLGHGIAELGGLHVICCQHNASRRIDRQLLGRCARRGDPGSAQSLLALDKPLLARFAPSWFTRHVGKNGFEHPQWLVKSLVRAPQRMEERRQRLQRQELLRQDFRAEHSLSFGGPIE